MSDRALWLEQWCPECRVAPDSRWRASWLRTTRSPSKLHVARVARTAMPDMQGTPRRAVPHPIGSRVLAHARGSAATRSPRADLGQAGLAASLSAGARRSPLCRSAAAPVAVAGPTGSCSVASTATSACRSRRGPVATSCPRRSRHRSGIASDRSPASRRSWATWHRRARRPLLPLHAARMASLQPRTRRADHR
jgi:hypothetical protein